MESDTEFATLERAEQTTGNKLIQLREEKYV